jgi:HD-like signal output (HDOD) protein
MADEAFVAGLLHDIGRVVLACNFPADYAMARRQALDQGIPLEAAEERIFACTHADVGGYLLGLWGLPGAVVEAIALHHTPAQHQDEAFTPLTAVHIGNVLDTQRDPRTRSPVPASLDEPYLERLGLQTSIQAWRNILQACFQEESP